MLPWSGKTALKRDDLFCLLWGLVLNLLYILATWKYGLAISTDSANYFSAAKSFASGEGFVQFDGVPFLNAVPLYPLLICPAYLMGVDPLVYAWLLNLLLLNCFLLLLARSVRRYFPIENSWVFFALCSGSYFSFIHAGIYALSELPFMVLLVSWIAIIECERNEVRYQLAGSLLLGILCMDRYMGLMLIPGFMVCWIVQRKGFQYILTQISIPLVFLFVWALRNYFVSGEIAGGHHLTDKLNILAPAENILGLLRQTMENPMLTAPVVVFVLLVILLVYHGYKTKGPISCFSKLMGFGMTVFLALLFFQKGLLWFQVPRYLCVFWPFLLLPFSHLVLHYLKAERGVWIVLLLAVIQLGLLLNKSLFFFGSGAGGFNSDDWQKKSLQEYLKALPSGNYCSNYPDMVWWITGRNCSYTPFVSESETDFRARLKGASLLIWFRKNDRNHVMRTDVLSPLNAMKTGSFGDIEIYTIQVN